MKASSWSGPLAGLLVGLGIALAGYFASQTLLLSRTAVNTASVKGLSERTVLSDQYSLPISYSYSLRSLGAIDREEMFNEASQRRDALLAELVSLGVQGEEINASPLRYSSADDRDNEGRIYNRTHYMSGSIRVASNNVGIAQDVYEHMAELAALRGYASVSPPSYEFTGLNDIKPDMVREATQNARIAADEFAKNAGVTVGSIQTAAQGGFSVRDLSDSSYSSGDLRKRVRVVTTITFYLRD